MTRPRRRTKPSSVFPPSLVFLLLTVVSVTAELVKPLPLLPGNPIRIVVGPVLILLGTVLWLLAWREFRRHGEVFGHQYTTETVVTTGPYRISRHPAYLAYAVIMLGIGLLVDCAWTLVLLPLAVLIVDGSARREEAYLMAKHEGLYRPYRSEVRRWI
ncbi:MAG: isoprenylcysteine carboxylmethyltransferase family protein [Sphingomonadales bacterium]